MSTRFELVTGDVFVYEDSRSPDFALTFLQAHRRGDTDDVYSIKRQDPLVHCKDPDATIPPIHNLYITTTRIGFGVGHQVHTFRSLKDEQGQPLVEPVSGRGRIDPIFSTEHRVQDEWFARVFDQGIEL